MKRASLIALISLVIAPRVHAQAAAMLVRAKATLDSGQFARAEAIYDSTIALAHDSASRGNAYFGRAYSAQRRLMADGDSLASGDAQRIADDYRRAAALRPSIAGAAATNESVALQAGGLSDAAVKALQRARPSQAGRGGSARPITDASALLRIGGLFEKQGQNDSARVYFSRALKADPSSQDALRAKLMFNARTGASDSLFMLAAKTLDSAATAPIVDDALLTFLDATTARSSAVDSSLILCARAWATMRLGPTSFAEREGVKLRAFLAKSPNVNAVIGPMLDAYQLRVAGETYRESGEWWHANDSRRSAWSHMLRSLGDSYNATGNTAVAASYYEAAVGLPNPQFERAWVDLDALLPLALIYAQRAEGRGRADDLVRRVDELTNLLFYGKMRAIEAGDYQRIRAFHMTLGAMFAAQERWDDGPRGAVYQIENMRKMTAKANETSHAGLTDPPALLEKLAKRYQVTGNAVLARSTAVAAATAYQRLGKTLDVARVSSQFGVVARR